jgi:4-hydroxy-2-oxoheptanedioate aldolase
MGETMRVNNLKRALREGRIVLGPFMKMSSPALVEIMGHAGFDFVIIDTEHAPLNFETVENLIRAADLVDITPIVRVTENNPALILRALDAGALGVEVPHISSKEDATRAVRAAKFTPEGERGVCRFVRAAEYSSMDRYEYFKKANEETMVIIHIEGLKGINNLEDILTVEGLDVIFIGPYDLSQSLGVPGQVDHPLVIEKMKEVIAKARQRAVAVGTFVDDEKVAEKWINAGVQYISYSVDVGIFYDACQHIVGRVKPLKENVVHSS